MRYYVRGKYGDVSKSWWVKPQLPWDRVGPFTRALVDDGCVAVDVTGWM